MKCFVVGGRAIDSYSLPYNNAYWPCWNSSLPELQWVERVETTSVRCASDGWYPPKITNLIDEVTFPFPIPLTSHLYCRSRGRASVCQRPHPSSHRADRQKVSSLAAESDCHWSAGPAGNKSSKLQGFVKICIHAVIAYMLNYNTRKYLRHSITWKLNEKYLHRMANETEGGCVSRTCVIRASAVQQAIKHPSVLAGPITGPTAEEWMGAVVVENRHQRSIFSFFEQWRKGDSWCILALITALSCFKLLKNIKNITFPGRLKKCNICKHICNVDTFVFRKTITKYYNGRGLISFFSMSFWKFNIYRTTPFWLKEWYNTAYVMHYITLLFFFFFLDIKEIPFTYTLWTADVLIMISQIQVHMFTAIPLLSYKAPAHAYLWHVRCFRKQLICINHPVINF